MDDSFRFYIVDLYNQLEREYQQSLPASIPSSLYRGQRIWKSELDKLQKQTGTLVSTNAFFSTTEDRDMALGFTAGSIDTDDEKHILIEIVVDSQLKRVTFAKTNGFSRMKENEILFNLGTIFKLHSVGFDSTIQKWKVIMLATDEGYTIVQDYLALVKIQINETEPVLIFGHLLDQMGQFQKSAAYFNALLKSIPDNVTDEFKASIHNYLGDAYLHQGQDKQAVEEYIVAYDLRMAISTDHPGLVHSLISIGATIRAKGDSDRAILCLNEVKMLLEKRLSKTQSWSDAINEAITLRHIGLVYVTQKNYSLALDFFVEALTTLKDIIPSKHPLNSKILWAIGNIYIEQNNVKTAIKYYKDAFTIMEDVLPTDHPELLKSLNQLIYACSRVPDGDYGDLSLYATKTIDLQSNAQPWDLYRAYDKIGDIYKSINNLEQSLLFKQKALSMLDNTVIVQAEEHQYFNSNANVEQGKARDDSLVTRKVCTLRELGDLSLLLSFVDQAIDYYNKYIDLQINTPGYCTLIDIGFKAINIFIFCSKNSAIEVLEHCYSKMLPSIEINFKQNQQYEKKQYLQKLAKYCWQQNELHLCLSIFKKLEQIQRQDRHWELVDTLYTIGLIYVKLNNNENCLKYLKEALVIEKQNLSIVKHKITLNRISNIEQIINTKTMLSLEYRMLLDT
ncbi:unnamed protein product [Didymodactylos carnosus]|uniref:Uncharacterized protein n=1 Tax=Didymodactylos carnosus TaxID=1234261 RepID=A0A814P4C3_9BILA|nr:unnamed protein product [Didymodactylos carnosus]CAF3867177.1 unnamed protein product [Didymodactylos carnosus]